MKVDEFLQGPVVPPGQQTNRDPGDESVLADSVTSPTASNGDETVEPEFQHVTSLTPSGIECLYSWAPKRLYRLRSQIPNGVGIEYFYTDWVDVPSVTTALGILEKPALPWWGMKVGVQGVLELNRKNVLVSADFHPDFWDRPDAWDVDSIVQALTQHKLTVNHVKDKAADRGTNVHGALESWAIDQSYRGNPDLYEEHERGYIVGLNKFLDDLGEVEEIQAEVMVGSLEYGFGGRYDLRLVLPEPRELVTRIYPKRADKREVVPAGKYLNDLKSSRHVYPSHGLQLIGYEIGSIECGYGPTDYRAVIHVTQDGKYEFVRTHAQPEDFLSILQAYNTMQGAKTWIA